MCPDSAPNSGARQLFAQPGSPTCLFKLLLHMADLLIESLVLLVREGREEVVLGLRVRPGGRRALLWLHGSLPRHVARASILHSLAQGCRQRSGVPGLRQSAASGAGKEGQYLWQATGVCCSSRRREHGQGDVAPCEDLKCTRAPLKRRSAGLHARRCWHCEQGAGIKPAWPLRISIALGSGTRC